MKSWRWRAGDLHPPLLGQEDGVPVFPDGLGRTRAPRPFGDEPRFLREPAKVRAPLLRRFGSLIVDTRRPGDVGFVLDVFDLQARLTLTSPLLQPATRAFFHIG